MAKYCWASIIIIIIVVIAHAQRTCTENIRHSSLFICSSVPKTIRLLCSKKKKNPCTSARHI